ncbi:hypothetical protein DVH05_021325 [Phytophthora capsici]|nr:hypothetical protein DVH05_021325 [Phytophthora capsici]
MAESTVDCSLQSAAISRWIFPALVAASVISMAADAARDRQKRLQRPGHTAICRCPNNTAAQMGLGAGGWPSTADSHTASRESASSGSAEPAGRRLEGVSPPFDEPNLRLEVQSLQ